MEIPIKKKKSVCEFTKRVNYTNEKLQLVTNKFLLNSSKLLQANSKLI